MDISLITQVMKHDMKRKILQKLIYKHSLKFSELCENLPSSQFNFHLQYLIDAGIIEKKDGKYNLTKEFNHIGNYLDVEPMMIEKPPLSVVTAIIFNEDKSQILLQFRKKKPFMHLWTCPTAKAKFHEHFNDTLKREIKEETGLQVEGEMKAIFSERIFENDRQVMHDIVHWFECRVICGELHDDVAGENKWIDVNKLRDYELIADILPALEKIKEPFKWYDAIWHLDKKTYELLD